MSKRSSILLLLAFLSLIFAPKASFSADTTLFGSENDRYGVKPHAIRFEAFNGIYWNGLNQSLLNNREYITDTWTVGLSLGYSLTEFLELGTYFAYTKTKSTIDRQDVYQISPTVTLQLPGLSDQVVPYLKAGVGVIGIDNPSANTNLNLLSINTDWDLLIQYGAGVKFFIFKSLYLAPDFRALTSINPTHTAFMATLNLGVYAGAWKDYPYDQDRDGVADNVDRCPKDPETVNGYQDDDGCPDTIPGEAQEIVEKAEPAPNQSDRDRDGIPDAEDKCPDEAEDLNDYMDRDGCPDADRLSLDRDRDLIPLPNDKCPERAEDYNDYFDEDGCPDAEQLANDSDRDGIVDDYDKCPEQAEVVNEYKDADGCPDHELQGVEGRIPELTFQVGNSVIDEASYDKLDELVDALNRYPEALIRLQGHTDSTGSMEINMKLSRERAKSVQEYLIKEGVDSSRVTFEGFGPNRPVSSNKTWLGRQQNRRVEVKVMNPDALYPKVK